MKRLNTKALTLLKNAHLYISEALKTEHNEAAGAMMRASLHTLNSTLYLFGDDDPLFSPSFQGLDEVDERLLAQELQAHEGVRWPLDADALEALDRAATDAVTTGTGWCSVQLSEGDKWTEEEQAFIAASRQCGKTALTFNRITGRDLMQAIDDGARRFDKLASTPYDPLGALRYMDPAALAMTQSGNPAIGNSVLDGVGGFRAYQPGPGSGGTGCMANNAVTSDKIAGTATCIRREDFDHGPELRETWAREQHTHPQPNATTILAMQEAREIAAKYRLDAPQCGPKGCGRKVCSCRPADPDDMLPVPEVSEEDVELPELVQGELGVIDRVTIVEERPKTCRTCVDEHVKGHDALCNLCMEEWRIKNYFPFWESAVVNLTLEDE